jgi:ABC-type dipeptide/oligopeptide/nickel transport system permease subunit
MLKKAGVIFLILHLVISVIALLFWKGNLEIDEFKTMQSPSILYPMGFDSLGRNLFLRTIYGGWTSITVALVAGMITYSAGMISALFYFGLSQGFRHFFLKLLDIWISIPAFLFFTFGLVFLKSKGEQNLSDDWVLVWVGLFLGLSFVGLVGRFSVGLVHRFSSEDFMAAGQVLGMSRWQLAWRELMPNLRPILIAYTALQIPQFILFESVLSFLGLGLRPPHFSWGLLIQETWRYVAHFPHMVLGPSIYLLGFVFSVNIQLEQFRRRLDFLNDV